MKILAQVSELDHCHGGKYITTNSVATIHFKEYATFNLMMVRMASLQENRRLRIKRSSNETLQRTYRVQLLT